MTPKPYRLAEMLPDEVEARLAEFPAVVVPFGTLEWHSYHLPLGLDTLVIEAICEAVAAQSGAALAPTVTTATGGAPFPYTHIFDLDLIERLALQMFRQLSAMGFKVILALSGHYTLEQMLALKRAACQGMADTPATIFAGGEYEVATDLGFLGDHAAKWETSMLWALRPELVKLDKLNGEGPAAGIYGDRPPSEASAELGTQALETIQARFAEMACRLLQHTNRVERAGYLEALTAIVRVLERMMAERGRMPKARVPGLVTPAYEGYLEAVRAGDYAGAKQFADAKWIDLSQ